MKTKRKILGFVLLTALVLGGAVNIYATAGVLNYRDPKGYGIMQCTSQAYSTGKGNGTTKFSTSDYRYYKAFVRVMIYKGNGYIDVQEHKEANAITGVSLTVKPTKKSNAKKLVTAHRVTKGGSSYIPTQYINIKY
ncbi:MAG: hypothetical protein II919_05225 [Lachnospiraceae bacterium]|nr:hypothetical protein [Lachnospiraceae bacterium]